MAEISEIELKEYRKLKDSKERQYKRQNEYIKNNFYRVSVTLPKEYKSIIASAGVGSVNGYITGLVRDDLTRRGLLSADTSGSVSPSSGVPVGVPVPDPVEDTKNAGVVDYDDIIPPFI